MTEIVETLLIKEGRDMGKRDESVIHEFLFRMKLQDHIFFHIMDVDNEGRVRNKMWVHPRSIAAYEDFHNDVSVDTILCTDIRLCRDMRRQWHLIFVQNLTTSWISLYAPKLRVCTHIILHNHPSLAKSVIRKNI